MFWSVLVQRRSLRPGVEGCFAQGEFPKNGIAFENEVHCLTFLHYEKNKDG